MNVESIDCIISLRDQFALQTLRLFTITPDDIEQLRLGNTPEYELVADFCYKQADAMMERRKKK